MYNMVADQIDILDAKGIQRCVSVGHDWGSVLAQRIYLFRPERVEAICLMNVAYRPPAEKPGDLEEMRAVLEITIGYFPAWYWYLFLSPEGAKVLDDHLESLFDACSGGGQRLKDLFCTKDGLKTFYWRTNRPKLPSMRLRSGKGLSWKGCGAMVRKDRCVGTSQRVSILRWRSRFPRTDMW